METKLFYGTITPYYNDALAVRYTVFSTEQGYDPGIDIDSVDAYAWHVVCYEGRKPIATARLYESIADKSYGIGRVAVLPEYRKQKLGNYVMEQLMAKATEELRHRYIILHSQVHAIPFYTKLGFELYGPEFLEEGQPHQGMIKTLKVRGFEVAKGYEAAPVVIPVRKTVASAGYDLTLIEATTIPAKSTILAKTGLKAYMRPNEVLEIYIRSSIAIKKNVWCANNVGIIDADYYENPDNDGHIMIPLYNANDSDITFTVGERVAQGIFKPYLTVDGENLENTEVRSGGFGSTGTDK